jgi:hypothetical protein
MPIDTFHINTISRIERDFLEMYIIKFIDNKKVFNQLNK